MKLLIVVLALLAITKADSEKTLHPAAGLSLVDLMKYYGYPLEIHEDIQTPDGYLLTMHRIPHGLNNANETNKPVVVLMHCLSCSSAIYASYGPEKGLAFILADQGYDVWMPNGRGNQFSKKHVTLDPVENGAEFWKFSWHEIGSIDLPTSIDYIIEKTGVQTMSYVGFSQGTTSFFVMGTTRPEYNDLFNVAVQLAPIGYMSNMYQIIFKPLAKYVDALVVLLDELEWYEVAPNLSIMPTFIDFCNDVGQVFCEDMFSLFLGLNATQLEESWLPVFITHTPAGCSGRQFAHYGQEILSGHFRQYDFGVEGNLIAYGTEAPPDYDLSKLTAPLALFYGEKDDFAALVDVEQLMNEVPNLIYSNLVQGYGHIDFVMRSTIVEDVYNDLVELLRSVNKK